MPGVVVVNTRLALIDLSGSPQPLHGCSDNITVMYNGEIYNFLELRQLLSCRGHKLHTAGDGEVIAHLYEDYGTDFVNYLRGAFAIVLVDAYRNEVHLIRDRLGEKPLVYANRDGILLFASDVRSLVASGVDLQLSHRAIDGYFHYGYVPEPGTVFRAVEKVPAGGMLTVRVHSNLSVQHRKWWSPDLYKATTTWSPEGHVAEMAEELEAIIRQQTYADAPVAVALSGGVDSSLLADVAARTGHRVDLTVNVSFEWAMEEEHTAASATARRLTLPLRHIRLSRDAWAALLIESIERSAEPIADWTSPAYLAIADECHRAGVRVLLTGHGADELFWGYAWVRSALSPQHTDRPCTKVSSYLHNPEFRAATIAQERVYGESLRPLHADPHRLFPVNADSDPASALRVELLRGYLRSNGLSQMDSLGLSKGVEVRLPYVDYRFVTQALETPLRLSDRYEKDVLRRIAERIAPGVRVSRKRPFFPDLTKLEFIVRRLIRSDVCDGYLVESGLWERKGVEWLLDRSPAMASTILLRLLVLERWLENVKSLRAGGRTSSSVGDDSIAAEGH